MNRTKNALIVGFGAMGHYGAWHLNRHGFKVFVLGQKEKDRTVHLKFQSDTYALTVYGMDSFFPDVFQFVYMSVKAFDIAQAWSDFCAVASGRMPTHVLTVANGGIWSLVASLAGQHPDISWNLGLSTVGVSYRDQYEIMSRSGKMQVGPIYSPAESKTFGEAFSELFSAAGEEIHEAPGFDRPAASRPSLNPDELQGENPKTGAPLDPARGSPSERPAVVWEFQESIKAAYQQKWLINTVLNTLCAARGYRQNQQALRDQSDLWELHQEAFRWYLERMDPDPSHPLELQTSFEKLVEVTQKTALNENSMARDIRLGRRTENEFLAGQVRLDPKASAKFPKLFHLSQTIEACESRLT